MNKRIRRLLVKYLNNTCTREEFEEVFDYINSQGVDFTDEMIKEVYHQYIPERRRTRTLLVQVAASVLLIGIAIVAVIGMRLNDDHVIRDKAVLNYVSTQTARSENRYLLLPDGTQVWLNAASTLEFPEQFTGAE